MHIELWNDNKDKALDMSRALGAPNRFINEFFSHVDQENFISSMQELMRSNHVQIKIIIEKISVIPPEQK